MTGRRWAWLGLRPWPRRAVTLATLAVTGVFLVQNIDPLPVRLLFLTVAMPGALLVAVSMVLGAGVAVLVLGLSASQDEIEEALRVPRRGRAGSEQPDARHPEERR